MGDIDSDISIHSSNLFLSDEKSVNINLFSDENLIFINNNIDNDSIQTPVKKSSIPPFLQNTKGKFT